MKKTPKTIINADIKDATMAAGKLAFSPGADGGRYATGHIRVNTQPADADTVTVNIGGTSKVYEFDNNSSVSGSNISVTIGGTTAITATNLAAAITTNQGTICTAAAHGTNTTVVDIRSKTAGGALTLSQSAAALVLQDNAQELAAGTRTVYFEQRTITAEDGTRARVRFDTGLTSIEGYIYRNVTSSTNEDNVISTDTITVSGGVIEIVKGTPGYATGNIVRIIVWGTA